jgi:hypothetical protein
MNILYIFLKLWGHIELFWIQHILPIITFFFSLLPKPQKKNELHFISKCNCVFKTCDINHSFSDDYDFRIITNYLDDNKYGKIIFDKNDISNNIELSLKHFTTIQLNIDEEPYDIELCNDYINYYVSDNIIDIHVFEYILNKSLDKYNLTIIDSECNIIDGNEKTRILINKDNYSIL